MTGNVPEENCEEKSPPRLVREVKRLLHVSCREAANGPGLSIELLTENGAVFKMAQNTKWRSLIEVEEV